MFLPILCIHFLLFLFSLVHFSPLNKGATQNYKELFAQHFPKFYILNILIPVLLVIYYLGISAFPVNYVDSFDKGLIYFLFVIYTIVILFGFIKLVGSELSEPNQEINNYKNFLIPTLYIFLYSSAALFSLAILHFTNTAFDLSKGEEHIAVIEHAVSRVRDLERDHSVDIKPDICGKNNLQVTGYVIDKIKVRSKAQKTTEKSSVMTEEVKLKAFVYKGLYGVRYIGRNMDVIK